MRNLKKFAFLALALALAAWPAASQMTMRTPELRGVFNPVVGSGAAYKSDAKNGSSDMEIAIVGKEDVSGKTGYWIEFAMAPRESGGRMYLKYLMVVDGDTTTVVKTIMQMPGMGPMDATAMMSRGGTAAAKQSLDSRVEGQRVGNDSITTPAGTFNCEHFHAKDGSWDAWLSPGVGPWGLVKSTEKSSNTSMVVTRVFSNAADHITGTPQPFDMQQMMQQMMRQRQNQ